MTIKRLLAIAFIFFATCFAWAVLYTALSARSGVANARFAQEVEQNWGSVLCQQHPTVSYESPTCEGNLKVLPPESSKVEVDIAYEARRKGLLWHRTYEAAFDGTYTIRNPLPIRQTLYVRFTLPAAGGLDRFSLSLGGKASSKAPVGGVYTEAVDLAPGEEAELRVSYLAPGLDRWLYSFAGVTQVRDFDLGMTTNFEDYDFPVGTRSANLPVTPREGAKGLTIGWRYEDIIGAGNLGMDMPKVLNPGPVAERMTFFAPISLLFFFAVLLMVAVVKKVPLHPMHFFFLAAGCFAFQLLFAYLVDHLGIYPAFAIAAAVSLLLVGAYLRTVAGKSFARIALIAQFAYMVLFSASFFVDGMTGITITIGAVATLALLMAFTAKTDWAAVFARPAKRAKTVPLPPTPPAAPQAS